MSWGDRCVGESVADSRSRSRGLGIRLDSVCESDARVAFESRCSRSRSRGLGIRLDSVVCENRDASSCFVLNL
jgi:hypothetical protein